MNKDLLIWTRNNLYDQLRRCQEEAVTADKKLEWLMMALADMCTALARESEE